MDTAVLRAAAGGWRRHGFKPFVLATDREAQRQAVRLGAHRVSQGHLLLALCTLHSQLDHLGLRVADRWRPYNDAANLLTQHGVATTHLVQHLWGRTHPEPALAPRSRPWRNRTRADLPFGASVAATDEDAHAHAAELGHDYAGTSHILMALVSHPETPASALLRGIGIDDRRLASDTGTHLGRHDLQEPT